MLRSSLKLIVSAAVAVVVALVSPRAGAAQPSGTASTTGVLILAHGGSSAWNDRVTDVAREVGRTYPTEVAFGMASRPAMVAALERLKARGVSAVVAVPLFVSSHSSVVTSTEYLLGLRAEAPLDLAIFARMSHGRDGAHGAGAPHEVGAPHGAGAPHGGQDGPDPTSPILVGMPVRMTPAFNRHPLVGAIVRDRALAISARPEAEAVVLVAHGPVPDDDNARWLADMRVLAESVRAGAPFAAVDVLTVRDDAGPALREAATAALRETVSAHSTAGRRVLVVPHLMAFGGIEQGIKKRLEGLDYTMAQQALLPDARVAEWVRANVQVQQSR
jgi:sirohydrochlorin ferrochelatase